MTVVIPVWDAPYVEYLPRAVASVHGQDPTVPIVVIDNASAVEVPELAGTTVVRSPRRLSAGAARNLGLQHIGTEYVIYLDADDELADGALATLHDGIAADPHLAAFVMSVIEADTGRRHRFPRRIAFALSRSPRLFALATAIWSLYPTQGCAIVRSDWVREAGGYADLIRGEDWILAVSLAFRGPVRLDRRPGRIYHRRNESLLGGGLSISDIRLAHRCIRDRLRQDPAVAGWARALLPLIACLQFLVTLIVPVYRAARVSPAS